MAISFSLPYKNKIPHIANPRLALLLLMIFLAAAFLFGLIVYIISPYWQARHFIQGLQQNNLVTAEQLVPLQLLQPVLTTELSAQSVYLSQWQGDGAKYIQRVWPTIASQQNPHQLLLLQFNSTKESDMQKSYSRFPSRFRLTLGDRPENTLWFEWTRQSWTDWRLSRLCIYKPQPLADLNTCASSSR